MSAFPVGYFVAGSNHDKLPAWALILIGAVMLSVIVYLIYSNWKIMRWWKTK